jgi:hypothetical protein
MRDIARSWPYVLSVVAASVVVVLTGWLTLACGHDAASSNAAGWLYGTATLVFLPSSAIAIGIILGLRHGLDWIGMVACLLAWLACPTPGLPPLGSRHGASLGLTWTEKDVIGFTIYAVLLGVSMAVGRAIGRPVPARRTGWRGLLGGWPYVLGAGAWTALGWAPAARACSSPVTPSDGWITWSAANMIYALPYQWLFLSAVALLGMMLLGLRRGFDAVTLLACVAVVSLMPGGECVDLNQYNYSEPPLQVLQFRWSPEASERWIAHVAAAIVGATIGRSLRGRRARR